MRRVWPGLVWQHFRQLSDNQRTFLEAGGVSLQRGGVEHVRGAGTSQEAGLINGEVCVCVVCVRGVLKLKTRKMATNVNCSVTSI